MFDSTQIQPIFLILSTPKINANLKNTHICLLKYFFFMWSTQNEPVYKFLLWARTTVTTDMDVLADWEEYACRFLILLS